MRKDVITSTFLHVALFIFLALGNLFFYKKIELHQINVSLVSGSALAVQQYKPLELNKEDLKKTKELNDNNKTNTGLKATEGKGESIADKEALATKNSAKDAPELLDESAAAKSAAKDNIVSESSTKENTSDTIPTPATKLTKEQQEKNLFADNIMAGLDKGNLSKEELQALNNQIKGCWYGQGGYNSDEDLKVELILTMNPDATIQNVEVLNQDSYNSPLRKTLLEQVLRALKDPKCKQLRLPMGAFSNWRIIHIIFNPKG